MPGGRPSTYSDEIVAVICERLAGGESMRHICEADEMPSRATVLRWLRDHELFRREYAAARELQVDFYISELLEIADDGRNDWMEKLGRDGEITGVVSHHEHLQRSRLRVDTRKWIAARMAPKKYGDTAYLMLSDPDGGPIRSEAVGISIGDLAPEAQKAVLEAIQRKAIEWVNRPGFAGDSIL